jgi:hypothetical protein
MAQLPHDPNSQKINPGSALAICRTDASHNCYLYRGSATSYKVLAHCTPEGTLVSSDPFFDPVRIIHAWQVSTPDVRTTW